MGPNEKEKSHRRCCCPSKMSDKWLSKLNCVKSSSNRAMDVREQNGAKRNVAIYNFKTFY